MGEEKYIGTPAPTKPEAQQVVTSVANASLPPVCAAGRGRREGYHVGFTNVSLTHTHTNTHTHTHCYRYIHHHSIHHLVIHHHHLTHMLLLLPTIATLLHPSYLMAPPPSIPPTPIPPDLAMATTPGDHAHYPTQLRPLCHCRYGCIHIRGDLLSLVLGHARPHPLPNTVNIKISGWHSETGDARV